MTLDEFAGAQGRPGHVYELERGRILVIEVPNWEHSHVVMLVDRCFQGYAIVHPGRIQHIAGGAECALRLPGMTSERHPDRAVYLTPPPNRKNPWGEWLPDIVVEVVSPRQEHRDYVVKREEYLAAGIREYWIVDPAKRAALRLVRRGDVWAEEPLDEKGVLRTPLLPALECPVADLFAGL